MSIVPTWPESRFITIGGLRRHYIALGDSGPAIVLLHGYADSWRSFEPLLPTLSKAFRVFAPDQRGHGLTGPAGGYEIADFADDAIAFIEAVAPEPVHLVGHSLGAVVGQRVAERRRELLRSLTLIAPAPTAAGNATLKAVRAELAEFGDAVPDDFIEAFQASGLESPLRESRLNALVGESRRLTPEAWRGVLDGLLGEPPVSDHGVIRAPTLSIWGARDGIFDRGAQVALARAIPQLESIHYAGVGHAPHWEIPDQVASEIVGFIRSVGPHFGARIGLDTLYAD